MKSLAAFAPSPYDVVQIWWLLILFQGTHIHIDMFSGLRHIYTYRHRLSAEVAMLPQRHAGGVE